MLRVWGGPGATPCEGGRQVVWLWARVCWSVPVQVAGMGVGLDMSGARAGRCIVYGRKGYVVYAMYTAAAAVAHAVAVAAAVGAAAPVKAVMIVVAAAAEVGNATTGANAAEAVAVPAAAAAAARRGVSCRHSCCWVTS